MTHGSKYSTVLFLDAGLGSQTAAITRQSSVSCKATEGSLQFDFLRLNQLSILVKSEPYIVLTEPRPRTAFYVLERWKRQFI